MKKLFMAAMAIILIALTSCDKDTIVGNGSVMTEQRSVAGFSKIEVVGKTGVTINYGANFKVEVKAFRNLLPALETKLNGDVLRIGYKSGTKISNDNSEVMITMPLLTKFSATGSSEVSITSGTANNFEAVLTGSGKIRGLDFTVKNAKVSIEGSSTASFSITDKLHATIVGSGIVYYKGNAVVTTNITGSGKVEKL
jgi:hypothetical protein